MVDSLLLEMQRRSGFFGEEKLDTVYFGGGTPSLLQKKEIHKLLDEIIKNFKFEKKPEITIEANPEDLTYDKIKFLKNLGFNRLSIGIQSFSDEELHQLNRVHTAKQSKEAIRSALAHGFDNISIDLMFGLPGSNDISWKNTLNQAAQLGVHHISCYNLTIEEKTALWHFVNKKKTILPSESQQEDQFMFAHHLLFNSGYDHYEISNYAKPGYNSKHNSNYWNRLAYLGIGPSAHSFLQNSRYWNVSNNSKYIHAIALNECHYENEILSNVDVFNELIMLGLRQKQGVSKNDLIRTGLADSVQFIEFVKKQVSISALQESEDSYYLNPDRYYLADHISSQLFLTNDQN